MTGRIHLTIGFLFVSAALCCCSKGAPAGAASTASQTPGATADVAGTNSCKDFPIVLYPDTTSAICEKTAQRADSPLHYTAYLASTDSVEQITMYYQMQVQSGGWSVDPTEVHSPTHSVVTIRKGKAYASVVVNAGANNSGSRTQINAFPNGNDLN